MGFLRGNNNMGRLAGWYPQILQSAVSSLVLKTMCFWGGSILRNPIRKPKMFFDVFCLRPSF